MYILRHRGGDEREELMVTKVQKWGNSQGVRFPQQILQEAHISVGDEVDVTVEQGRIVVVPSSRIRGRYNLAELMSRVPKDYEPHEVDWGPPVGREEW